MTEETRTVLMKRLDKIIGKLCFQEYLKANINKQGKLYKKHRPYSLTQEIEKAKELYNLLFFNDSFNNLTIDQEEQIKGYLLSKRTHWQN